MACASFGIWRGPDIDGYGRESMGSASGLALTIRLGVGRFHLILLVGAVEVGLTK